MNMRKRSSVGVLAALGASASLLAARVPEPPIDTRFEFAGRVAQASPRAEATSLGGQPLVPPADIPNRARLETDLAQAEKDLSARPNDADAIIWTGRRQAYLWRFQDAIATFTKGIALHPANPKLLRHRGHRYITVRQFDKALADLEKAAGLIKGTADDVEPDGAPNLSGKPRSTLHFNIWYHLGLAHYLTGAYTRALDAYTECMKVSTNDDAIVATSDWMWMTLMRLDRKADAATLLERISAKMEILENGSYHRRLLMYKGIEKPETLLDPEHADDLTIATQGYGVGNYFYVSGDRTRARQIFAKVTSGRQWNAFGFIAAEADLQRMK
jgi:tetratricopeptide (TPR) repeat protein